MSRIIIRFDEDTAHAEQSLVPIEVFDERLNLVKELVLRLPETVSLHVASPGLYAVRAELPSGEHITANVNVTSESPEVVAELTAREASPRESLAWAYAQQSVRHATGAAGMRGTLGSGTARMMAFAPAWPIVRIDGAFEMQATGTWSLAPVSISLAEDDSVVFDDERLVKEIQVGLTKDAPADQIAPLYIRYSVKTGPWDERAGIVVVPMAWEPSVLFVRNDRRAADPGTVRSLVRGARPEAESLLAYLTRGAFDAARRVGGRVVESATELLAGKGQDPFGASIAGYFLLATGRLPEGAWLRNLVEWFPRIPDGAVILGTCHLQHGEPEDRDIAKRHFLEAVDRGIPTYTIGLRLLLDGLRDLIDEHADDELMGAVSRVRQVAAFTDWTAQATSFALPQSGSEVPLLFAVPEIAGHGASPSMGMFEH